MKNEMLKIIRQLQGNILGIGLEENYVEALSNNANIIDCNLLNDSKGKKEKILKKEKTKKIKIKKLKNYFSKKSIDTILCKQEEITKYRNHFIRNSIFINKGKTIVYGPLEDLEEWIHKYRRYEVEIDVKKYKDQAMLTIDNTKSKSNVFKDAYYRMIDAIEVFVITIGDILMG